MSYCKCHTLGYNTVLFTRVGCVPLSSIHCAGEGKLQTKRGKVLTGTWKYAAQNGVCTYRATTGLKVGDGDQCVKSAGASAAQACKGRYLDGHQLLAFGYVVTT